MISIIVQQAPADYQGPDISDPLIISEAQALAKGRSAISKSHPRRVQVSGTAVMQPYMMPGAIVLYTDRHGTQYRAVLKRAPLTIDRQNVGNFSATTNIVLEYKK